MPEIDVSADLHIDLNSREALLSAIHGYLDQDEPDPAFDRMTVGELADFLEELVNPEPVHAEALGFVAASDLDPRSPRELLTPFEYTEVVYEGHPLDPDASPTDIGYCAALHITCRTDMLAFDPIQD